MIAVTWRHSPMQAHAARGPKVLGGKILPLGALPRHALHADGPSKM